MNLSFTEKEIKDKIGSSPELFSPNVITRCLYQQRILPNICYIGGPAEIVYWESFKKFFEYYDIPYPVLVPRDFVLLITTKIQKDELASLEKFLELGALHEWLLIQILEQAGVQSANISGVTGNIFFKSNSCLLKYIFFKSLS